MDTPESVLDAFLELAAQDEAERRAAFAPFGVDPDCLWPAARVYHEHSKFGPLWHPTMSPDEVEAHTQSLDYKQYPNARRIALPRPLPLDVGLESTIRARRTRRSYSEAPIDLAHLAKLLQLGAGVTHEVKIPMRAAPSAGALFPIEVYPVALRVEGLERAVHHYLPLAHDLEVLHAISGNEAFRRTIPVVVESHPALIIVLAARFARTSAKYLERGYRFALLEAGHIAQNMALVATGLGLGCACMGGFRDDGLNALLQLEPNEEAAVYALLFGHDRER